MLGHEIAGHSWSHPQLTTLTNEQIVSTTPLRSLSGLELIRVPPLHSRSPSSDGPES
jgi:peptidoglycan/xylan/chitin deacetylase (PgdA/CDA1 family)